LLLHWSEQALEHRCKKIALGRGTYRAEMLFCILVVVEGAKSERRVPVEPVEPVAKPLSLFAGDEVIAAGSSRKAASEIALAIDKQLRRPGGLHRV
jgi:hypothetical protein